MNVIYIGEVHLLGTVESRRITPWSVATIEKCKLFRPNGTTKTYYQVYVDGDSEGGEMTLNQAQAYIQKLVDSWLENHPGEKL